MKLSSYRHQMKGSSALEFPQRLDISIYNKQQKKNKISIIYSDVYCKPMLPLHSFTWMLSFSLEILPFRHGRRFCYHFSLCRRCQLGAFWWSWWYQHHRLPSPPHQNPSSSVHRLHRRRRLVYHVHLPAAATSDDFSSTRWQSGRPAPAHCPSKICPTALRARPAPTRQRIEPRMRTASTAVGGSPMRIFRKPPRRRPFLSS
mmetsp:Transcript_21148/g.60372  ORF Transcript_21148/g.60372 Transcript_21148/m.60372 type:complete len:202 (+) Transcript_21148:851-1456(+)